MTEPQPTLVTPREPADDSRNANDGKVKMQTLKSAPDPEVVRAAERSDREGRSGVEVRSARKRDFDGTMESPVEAPKPPSIPPLPLKSTSQAPGVRDRGSIARSEPSRHTSEAPKSDTPPSQRDTRVPSEAPGALVDARSASEGSVVKSKVAAAPPEVRTIVRETTPRWVMPVMVLVGIATIGSAVAVYLSLRTAADPGSTQDPGMKRAVATAPATAVTAAPKESASPAGTPPSVPSTMHVRIDVTPRAARVTLDKVLLTAHPIDETIPRDGKEHEIRVELAGYETFKKTFVGDGEVSLTITLKQLPQNAAANPPQQPIVPTPNTAPQQPTAPQPPLVAPPSTKPEEVYPTP